MQLFSIEIVVLAEEVCLVIWKHGSSLENCFSSFHTTCLPDFYGLSRKWVGGRRSVWGRNSLFLICFGMVPLTHPIISWIHAMAVCSKLRFQLCRIAILSLNLYGTKVVGTFSFPVNNEPLAEFPLCISPPFFFAVSWWFIQLLSASWLMAYVLTKGVALLWRAFCL